MQYMLLEDHRKFFAWPHKIQQTASNQPNIKCTGARDVLEQIIVWMHRVYVLCCVCVCGYAERASCLWCSTTTASNTNLDRSSTCCPHTHTSKRTDLGIYIRYIQAFAIWAASMSSTNIRTNPKRTQKYGCRCA